MRHHFVSQFYLRRWEDPLDQRVPTFLRKRDGQIDLVRFTTLVTGHEHDLYSFTNVDEEDKHVLEREFFTPMVDTPASPVLERLIQHGPDLLSQDERMVWTRFLVASRMRSPDFIRVLREGSPQEFIAELERRHNELRDELPPGIPTIKDFTELRAPALIENIGMTLLPQLISDSHFNQEILRMQWWVLDFSTVRFTLLTSDRPLWWSAPLAQEDCLLAMPITPNKLFMAARPAYAGMRRWDDLENLAKASNIAQCFHADRAVYGRASLRFVRKHMGMR